MKVPVRVDQIIRALYAQNLSLAKGTDDNRRQLTRVIAEQIAFELGPSWGTKSASPSRPQSKDGIAFLESRKPFVLMGYDWQNGTSRAPHTPTGNMIDMSTQHFLAVKPVNHLGVDDTPGTPPTPPVPPVTPPPSTPPPVNNQPAIDLLVGEIEKLQQRVSSLEARLANPIRTTTDAFHSHYTKI